MRKQIVKTLWAEDVSSDCMEKAIQDLVDTQADNGFFLAQVTGAVKDTGRGFLVLIFTEL